VEKKDQGERTNNKNPLTWMTIPPNNSPESTPNGSVSPPSRPLLLGSARLSFCR
jgi:hypothetical protein